MKIKKEDKIQHKFTYFGVQIRTFNTITHFVVYDLFYSLHSFQSFNEVREEEMPSLSSPAVFWANETLPLISQERPSRITSHHTMQQQQQQQNIISAVPVNLQNKRHYSKD